MEGTLLHAKAVTITSGLTSSITLTAANGSSINCNYIYITVSDVGAAGHLLVVPSGVSQYPALTLGNTASGVFGYVVDADTPREIILGAGRRCSALSITNVGTATANKTVLVNYGILYKLPDMDRGHSPFI